MNIIKLNGDKAELRKDNGSYIRTITDKAKSAYLNGTGELVVITKLDGKVELRKENGTYIRTITDKALDARFFGDDIAITKADSKIELRKENGSYIRTI
jgi:hypothetical protein